MVQCTPLFVPASFVTTSRAVYLTPGRAENSPHPLAAEIVTPKPAAAVVSMVNFRRIARPADCV